MFIDRWALHERVEEKKGDGSSRCELWGRGLRLALAKLLEERLEQLVLAYHSGMSASQKAAVRRAYESGQSRCIVSTTALAMGVNLPATHVYVGLMDRRQMSFSVRLAFRSRTATPRPRRKPGSGATWLPSGPSSWRNDRSDRPRLHLSRGSRSRTSLGSRNPGAT